METKKTVTPQEVVENVHKAAELLKTQGKEGLEILRDPQYELNTGDAYIFIIDVEESLVVSNPRFPERNGGNIREHLDWAGKHYGIEKEYARFLIFIQFPVSVIRYVQVSMMIQ